MNSSSASKKMFETVSVIKQEPTAPFVPFLESKEKKYEYMKLESFLQQIQNTSSVYLYGIISECSSVSKLSTTYSMKLNIIDETVNNLSHNNISFQIEINAKEAKFPHLVKLGDIIRIHRAKYSEFRERRTFSVTSGGASWIIFSGIIGEDFNPVYISSENYTFEESDKQTIITMRNFSKEYFRKEAALSKITFQLLPVKVQDVLQKCSKIMVIAVEKDFMLMKSSIILYVTDSQNEFKIKLPYKYYNMIMKEDMLLVKNLRLAKE